MSFATGFVTGLAKSVDDQLKNDMLRTQKRMDGMEQYRITRGRADIEREQKETREVGEVMKNLASLVGGDPYKAAQLYEAGGGTLSGATEFYQTTKKSQSLLGKKFDINKVVTLLENDKPNSIPMSDYVKNYVQGANTQVRGNQDFEASGLLGKMFGGSKNYIKTMDSNVKKAVGTSENKFGLLKVPTPKINHEAFIEFQKNEKDNRRDVGSSFEAEYLSLNDEINYAKNDEDKKSLIKRRDAIETKMIRQAELKRKATGTSSSIMSKEGITKTISDTVKGAVSNEFTETVGDTLKIMLNGNEGPVFEQKNRGVLALEKRFASVDKASEPILWGAIEAEKNIQKQERTSYIGKQYQNYLANTRDDSSTGYEKYQSQDVTASIIPASSITNEDATAKFKRETKALKSIAIEQSYPPGKVIEYKAPNGNTLRFIWTGQSLLQ